MLLGQRVANELRALAAELEANDRITVSERTAGPPASAEALASARAYGLGEELLALWKETNGFVCRWTETDYDEVRGGVEVLPLEEMLREDREGRIFFASDPADDPKRRYYPFERFDPFGNGHSCGLILDGSANPMVFYLSGEPELEYLATDLEAWVGLLRKTRGYLYWQSALLDAAQAAEIVEDLPRLFPGAELEAILVRA